MLQWVTIQKMSDLSGYTVASLRSKIQRGDFIEGYHWRKNAKDGRIQFNTGRFDEWGSGARLELRNVETA